MWEKWKKINKLRTDLDEVVLAVRNLEVNMERMVSTVANIRGIMNRKLYSGKMKEDEPSWLDNNLKFVGIDKDKKDEILGL